MLKVVGASFYKTKVSSIIILVALLLAIGALFILKLERPVPENVYCATSYWTPSTGYRVEFWGQGHHLNDVPKGAARICFRTSSKEVGEWPQMEIESNPNYSDTVQAVSSGILEGSLLWKSIYEQWTKAIDEPCSADENSERFCEWLRSTVSENYQSVKTRIDNKLNGQIDSYWYQIHLFYLQMEGIESGWRIGLKRSAMKRSGIEIPLTDILILNLGAELSILEDYYNTVVRPDATVRFALRPRQAVQLELEEQAERINLAVDHKVVDRQVLIVANLRARIDQLRSSFSSAMAPHRVLKKYKLNYRLAPAAKFSKLNGIVPGHDVVFTGYSGVVSSPDDFYAITGRHSKIVIAGVTLKYAPEKLRSEIDLQEVVPLAARVMASNRLAISVRTWTKWMKRDPNGAARQWLLVDRRVLHKYNSLVMDERQNELVEALLVEVDGTRGDLANRSPDSNRIGSERLEGLIWIVDNTVSRLHGEDVTEDVVASGKALLVGTPRFKETLEESGVSDGPTFEHLTTPQEELSHTVRFHALAPGRSEYMDEISVIYGGQSFAAASPPREAEDDMDQSERSGAEPALTVAGVSGKWSWPL